MISPAYEILPPHDDCERREERTNLLIMAMLTANATTNRVKVRNISESGALIEGPVLPRAGTDVILSRGDSALGGRIVWCAGAKAGVRFNGRAVVSQWLPNTNNAQREIDREVELAKAEKRAGLSPSSLSKIPSSRLLARDLTAMASALDELSNELAGDPFIVTKYMTRLQILDIVGQALTKCAMELAS